MDRVFDPLFTTKPVGTGIGLGLSAVHGAVQSHGGGIELSSEVGVGTRFDVWLATFERVEAAQVVVPVEAESDREMRDPERHRRILVVEDQSHVAEITCLHLEDLGFQAERVGRAESALDQVRADPSRFDLVITDLSMPGLDGMQLAKSLKDVSPEMPVVVMTGNVGELDTRALERTGVATVMRKPFGRPELEEILEAVLTRKSG